MTSNSSSFDSATPEDQVETFRRLAHESSEALPNIMDQIRSTIKSVDAIELVAKLHFMNQWSPSNSQPHRDEIARIQVKLEFLCWIIISQHDWDQNQRFIDGSITTEVMRLLDLYFDTLKTATLFKMPNHSIGSIQDLIFENELIAEQHYVRGENYWHQIAWYVDGLYGPHTSWMTDNLGFNINQATEINKVIEALISDQWNQRIKKMSDLYSNTKREFRNLQRRKQDNLNTHEKQLRDEIVQLGLTKTVRNYVNFVLFADCKQLFQITPASIQQVSFNAISAEVAKKYLDFAAFSFGADVRLPDPNDLNPLYEKPIWLHENNYYLPHLGLLWEFVLNAPHFAMMADESYRDTYDKTRAHWLETASINEIKQIIPQCHSYMNLRYGSADESYENNPYEADGVVIYGNRLILIEAKSKQLTMLARKGNVEMAKEDLRRSVLKAYNQAKRTIDYINSVDVALFVTPENKLITMRKEDISAIYIICISGKSTALGSLPARISHFLPVDSFDKKYFPAVIPLMDLHIFPIFIETASEFFDYLDRRNSTVKDRRFNLHDEWDLLGAYLGGHLDPTNPQFRDAHFLVLSGMDDEIDKYMKNSDGSTNNLCSTRPRHQLPKRIQTLLHRIETHICDEPHMLDVAVALLRFPNAVLTQIDLKFKDLAVKVAQTSIPQSATVFNKDTCCGITGLFYEASMSHAEELLKYRCTTSANQFGAKCWLGIGFEIGSQNNIFLHFQAPDFIPFQLSEQAKQPPNTPFF